MKERQRKATPEKTSFGPGKTPLYYNNVGLFSDPFLEDRLPNSHKEYGKGGFLNKFWDIEETPEFNKSFQTVLNIWNELDQDVRKYCDKERQLQNRWIDKIFKALGWIIELEETSAKYGQANFPDYGLYKNIDDWKKSKDLKGNNKFKKTLAIADAKDWGVNLDGKGFSNKNPSYQIINYLKQTDKRWGILTDGKYWRLYSTRSESKHTTYYEVDLIKILETNDLERFNYFYNFFRAKSFEPLAEISDRCFLDFVFEDGQFYSQRVENNLHQRSYRVVETICKGFATNYKNPSEDQCADIYENSLYYLFKLIFILNCESKGLLEVNKQDDYYEFSLRKKCIELKDQLEDGKNWSDQNRTYNSILDLFELLKNGDSKIGVHGFGNEPFSQKTTRYFLENKIPDSILNLALIDLSCDYDDEDELQFIDYKILSPDHIGSIFEGLLEFQLKNKKYTLKLNHDKKDKKDSGSYYTPSHIVDYMVEKVLLKNLKEKNIKQKLAIKICDPSMGSAHFLLGCLKFLETNIQEYANEFTSEEFDLSNIRNTILENCIYGVDINPLAVELAKFSLWMYASRKGEKLATLSKNLHTGDSLNERSFNWKSNFKFINQSGGFNAIIGNPPYVASKNTTINSSKTEGQNDLYIQFVDKFISDKILKEKGVFSMIIPDPFLIRDNAREVRKNIALNHRIEEILHVGNVFKEAGVTNTILFVKKNEKPNKKLATYRIINGSSKNGFYERKKFVNKQSNFIAHEEAKFLYLINNEQHQVYNKLQKSFLSIEDFFIDRRGEEVGKKQLKENEIKNGKKILLAGEGISPFEIKRSSIVTVKSSLIKKNNSLYEAPKIILQKSSPRFIAAFDGNCKDILYVTQAIYIIKSKLDLNKSCNEILLNFLTGLLNSDFANEYLFNNTTGYKLLMPHFEQKDIKRFPIPDLNIVNFKLLKNTYDKLKKEAISINNTKDTTEGFIASVAYLATQINKNYTNFSILNKVVDFYYDSDSKIIFEESKNHKQVS